MERETPFAMRVEFHEDLEAAISRLKSSWNEAKNSARCLLVRIMDAPKKRRPRVRINSSAKAKK